MANPKSPKNPRIPTEVDGIQVNFCKNPKCSNFGVPPKSFVERGRGKKNQDTYIISAHGANTPSIDCRLCGEGPRVKSNLAVSEELSRMLADLSPVPAPSCPDIQCTNHSISINSGKGYYQSFGFTPSGSKRYLCNACKKTFAVSSKPMLRQRFPEKNDIIFRLLMNKSPMKRICAVAEIHPETLYQRINFLFNQCKVFASVHERLLLEGKPIDRLYISVDRQDYTVNWSNQHDKRTVIMHALGSADEASGYVFGMHLDFDPSLNSAQIEADALAINDHALSYPYRKYARLWLKADYTDNLRQSRRKQRHAAKASDVSNEIAETYDTLDDRLDVEVAPTQTIDTRLPSKGMQVHSEYTLYGHFFYLKRLFGGVGKVRFFLDQESGIRAACLSAFCDEVKARKVDAFYVRINKNLTVNEKRQAVATRDKEFDEVKSKHPGLSHHEVESLMVQDRLRHMAAIGKWQDRWLLHPYPNMGEPEKAICYLTDYGDYSPDQLARLYLKAGLHPIDRFFMQIRRMISLFERPISTSSAQNRSWFGYSPYNPEVAMKLLTIYRVYYNY